MAQPPPAESAPGNEAAPASAKEPLPADRLRRPVAPEAIGAISSRELAGGDLLVGQQHALNAIDFGLDMPGPGYNVFVVAPADCTLRGALTLHLAKRQAQRPPVDDWILLPRPDDPQQFTALRLPAGRARPFFSALVRTRGHLAHALAEAFATEDYQIRVRVLEEDTRARSEEALEALTQKAAAQNVALLRTSLGYTLMPMLEGGVVDPGVFQQLPQSMREQVEARIAGLEGELQRVLQSRQTREAERRSAIAALEEEIAREVVGDTFADLEAAAAEVEALSSHVGALKSAVARDGRRLIGSGSLATLLDAHLVASHAADGGAPLVVAGKAARATSADASPAADTFPAGDLHQANGGILLVDADRWSRAPEAWQALLATLERGAIGPAPGRGATIPLAIKTVAVGTPETHARLCAPDSSDLLHQFKVTARFVDTLADDPDATRDLAAALASLVATYDLLPASADALARLIEESRRAAPPSRLSLNFDALSEALREASHWSQRAGRSEITRDDVVRGLSERARRDGPPAAPLDSTDPTAACGCVPTAVVEAIGQVHWGRPARVRATSLRSGHTPSPDNDTTVERHGSEAALAELYGSSAVGAVRIAHTPKACDGERRHTALAEALAAVSALADLPARQGLAVVGGLSAIGAVLPVPDINQRIEAVFAAATGDDAGIVIPEANADALMVAEDVAETVAAGRFRVYAVSTLDDAIALALGVAAGARTADGSYPEGSVHRRVADALSGAPSASGIVPAPARPNGKAQG